MKVFEILFFRDHRFALFQQSPESFFPGETITGKIQVEGGPDNRVELRWVDAHDRFVAKIPLAYALAENAYRFSLHLTEALTVYNRLFCLHRGKCVAEAEFMATPVSKAWDDFHTVVWAG